MPTMSAVKLVPENFSLITSTIPDLPLIALQEMYDDGFFKEEPYYILTCYVEPSGDVYPGWAGITESRRDKLFDFDKDKIDTEFVEITYKK